jgi:hypothetical protein
VARTVALDLDGRQIHVRSSVLTDRTQRKRRCRELILTQELQC